MEIFLETALDALLDTLKLLPFLIVIYILIELLEHKTSLASENSRLSGRLGVLIGAATGLIPQCGFSVMAAKLYDRGFIAAGTLIAVFISTSDEAFVILLSSGEGALALLPLILIKILVGVAVGYTVNAVISAVKKRKKAEAFALPAPSPEAMKADYHAHVFVQKGEKDEECTSCGRAHDEKHPLVTYFVNPLLHSLKIALYIYLVTLAFGLLVGYIGEDRVMDFMSRNIYVQPFIAALVGLIPNCASSVILTQSFLVGGISFGSLTAGLCANAGLGFVVLLKNTKEWKRNLALLAGMYVVAVAVGLCVNGVEAAVAAAAA